MTSHDRYTNAEFNAVVLSAMKHDQAPAMEKLMPRHAAGDIVWRLLCKRYPVFAEGRPLACGIANQIERPPWMLMESLRSALRIHTSTKRYLKALAAPDSQRYSLDGVVAGEVTDEQRENARRRLLSLSGKKMRSGSGESGTVAPTREPPPNPSAKPKNTTIAYSGDSFTGRPKLVTNPGRSPAVVINKKRRVVKMPHGMEGSK